MKKKNQPDEKCPAHIGIPETVQEKSYPFIETTNHHWMKKILFSLLALFFFLSSYAQENAAAHQEMPTGLRAEGKIYVVFVVVLTILAGLFVYLIRLDRKIARLEKSS